MQYYTTKAFCGLIAMTKGSIAGQHFMHLVDESGTPDH
jgi:hypothetical protein